ncbi:hypothetical protein DMC30DRAFT_411666 [Rhodotorula diobovata]|uniref:Rieske domain-containing protein n=1 Tax=Rhodotorula diobovata TaxID=5288 RepID=A0A5C5FX73_9BASI|nr:hypothetical protein DMC30DRAFT_411666 [Rhodotorula diobovata]
MKEIPFPSEDSESKILLTKVKGQYFANSNKCTHYGAPLVKGVLTESGRITCPWHGACFNVCSNGDIEDAPGLNSLQAFKVETDGSSVYVYADEATVANSREPTAPSVEIQSAPKHANVLIIGGGAGAAHAVEALREEGYTGSIRVVSKEPHLPGDRTKISKALISDPNKLLLRSQAFYDKLKAQFILDTEATKLDFASATVELSNGEQATYDNLILATGAFPTKLPLDGVDLANIFTVRGVKDAEAINAAVGSPEKDDDKKNVVIVGSSFIGMEVALALADKAKLTVVGMEDAPFSKILGEPIGNGIRKFHESKGTKFILPAQLSHFTASEQDKSRVGAVHLKDGTVLPADAVVIGAGVKPATDLLKAAGLSLEKNASVKTDDVLEVEQLKGKHKGRVFALGDIATFDTPRGPNYVQHWNVASNHGRAIAHHIATDKREPFDKVAIFWSAQGQQLRYAGTTKASEWDDMHVAGNPDELKFVSYYFKGDQVVAAASMQSDPVVAHISELMRLDKMLSKQEIKDGKSPLDVKLA